MTDSQYSTKTLVVSLSVAPGEIWEGQHTTASDKDKLWARTRICPETNSFEPDIDDDFNPFELSNAQAVLWYWKTNPDLTDEHEMSQLLMKADERERVNDLCSNTVSSAKLNLATSEICFVPRIRRSGANTQI